VSSSKTYKPTLVVILSRFPYPLEKGDKLRAFYQLQGLSKKYSIHLICTIEEEVKSDHLKEVKQYCSDIHLFKLNPIVKYIGLLVALFTQKPFQVTYFYQLGIHRKIKKILNEVKPDHIYAQLVRTSEYVKNYHDCPKTLDYMDAFSKGIERRVQSSKGLMKYILRLEFARLSVYERQVFEYFENHSIISEQDRSYILHPKAQSIAIIENGVSSHFFETIEVKKTHDVVFTGNMSYPPNIEAVKYIHEQIKPLLSEKTTYLISGINPHRSLLKMKNERFLLSGWVDDIRLSYASSRIFVAPMFLGTGLQNKLLEAMAMGIPCVTTELANKALRATPDKEILIASNPEEFKDQINKLLFDNTCYENISKAGQLFVQQAYSWDTMNQKLIDLIEKS
jgi:glycosyltransferase involved in cell wall biosynthesis